MPAVWRKREETQSRPKLPARCSLGGMAKGRFTKGRFSVAKCGVAGVEAAVADTSHAFGRHMHDQYGIGVIMRGAQKSASGRGTVEAQAGDIITVNPAEVHDGTPLGQSGRAWRMLYFEPKALANEFLDLRGSAVAGAEFSRPALRDSVSATRFLSLFRAMTDLNGGHSEIEARENLLLLLPALIDHRQDKRPPETPQRLSQARARIDDDPSAPLSLLDLASICDLSQFQLIRGFSKYTGLTPHAYLIQRRLQKARRLIAGGTPLVDAAQASGFADQSHMTRLFVRAYGLSPGLYAAAMN